MRRVADVLEVLGAVLARGAQHDLTAAGMIVHERGHVVHLACGSRIVERVSARRAKEARSARRARAGSVEHFRVVAGRAARTVDHKPRSSMEECFSTSSILIPFFSSTTGASSAILRPVVVRVRCRAAMTVRAGDRDVNVGPEERSQPLNRMESVLFS